MSQPTSATSRITVEVCTGSLDGARQAESAGADRIELNTALELDGLTPSAGLLKLVANAIRIPIITMARPRAGDFCYTDSEWETLMTDVQWMLDHGAHGIAFGCLDEHQQVDWRRCEEIRELVGSHELVFHKAFDDVVDWRKGLTCLINSGVNRVMTSGQNSTAELGLAVIAEIVAESAQRIEVIPAGRVSSENALKIVAQSGCTQLHGSFSSGESGDIEAEIRRTISRLASRPIDH